MRIGARLLGVAAAMLVVGCGSCSVAFAALPGAVWMTPDVSRPSVDAPPWYQGVSADGSTVFFISGEPYTGVNPGPNGGLFASDDGSISLVARSTSVSQPEYRGSSADGSDVFLEQPEGSASDLESYDDGSVTSVAGPTGDGSSFICASPDGSRVVFSAESGGLDSHLDIYAWSAGTVTLLTPDP